MLTVVVVIVLGVLGWVACGTLAYGGLFAYCQREFTLIAKESYDGDRRFAAGIGVLGPFGLIAMLVSLLMRHGFALFKHGLKFK